MNSAAKPYQKTAPVQRACGNCDFFHQETGRCRRRPPVVFTSPESAPETVWPRVTEHQWCGEFRPAVQA